MVPEWSWAIAMERGEGGELVAVVVLRWRCAGIIIIILYYCKKLSSLKRLLRTTSATRRSKTANITKR